MATRLRSRIFQYISQFGETGVQEKTLFSEFVKKGRVERGNFYRSLNSLVAKGRIKVGEGRRCRVAVKKIAEAVA